MSKIIRRVSRTTRDYHSALLSRRINGPQLFAPAQIVIQPPPPPPPATWPNMPGAYTLETDQGFDFAIPVTTGNFPAISGMPRWLIGYNDSGYTRKVTNDTGIISPPNALEFFYPSGFGSGSGVGTMFYGLTALKKKLYVGYDYVLPNNYQGNAQQSQKTIYLMNEGQADHLILLQVGSSSPYMMSLYPSPWGSLPGRMDPGAANGGTKTDIVPTVRTRVEIQLEWHTQTNPYDGWIKWWISTLSNGVWTAPVLQASLTGVQFPTSNGFEQVRIDSTWGGQPDTKTHDDPVRYDHFICAAA